MTTLHRRHFLASLGAGLAVAGLPARPARASEPVRIGWATLAIGFTPIFATYMTHRGFDREQGIELVNTQTYVDPGTYYNDFVAGRFDAAIGTWDSFAARYLQGVPIRLVSTMTTADIVGILVRADGAKSVAELRGKQLAAPKATGTYRLTSLLLKRFHTLTLETDIPVLNVPSPTTAVTYLLADRADAALGWEPSLSIGLQKKPDARLIYNLGADYKAKTNDSLYFFSIAVHKAFLDRHKGIEARLLAALKKTGDEFHRNFDEAISLAAKTMKIDDEAVRTAFRAGRIRFVIEPMQGSTREALRRQADFLTESGVFPKKVDEAFFHASA
jgi:NitT/TauT family transport system substrate-binding protein